MSLNVVLIPILLTKDEILDIKMAVTNLLRVFTKFITAKGAKEEKYKSVEEEEDDVASEGGETENKTKDIS